jgi:CheY-like chemotaxis protein
VDAEGLEGALQVREVGGTSHLGKLARLGPAVQLFATERARISASYRFGRDGGTSCQKRAGPLNGVRGPRRWDSRAIVLALMAKESGGASPVVGVAPPNTGQPLEPFDPPRAKLVHDIRNPLAIVTTNLDFVLGELEAGRSGDELHAAIQDARDAAERLAMIADGLDARTNETGQRSISEVTGFAKPQRGSGTRARMARILVVDDEPALGAALRRSLRDYDVVVTVSGREALARLATGERFDFILCDLAMPAMGGEELYLQIQGVAPDQAQSMVFITGGATTERARRFLENVPNPVIYKPYDATELREMIRKRIASGARTASLTSSRP